MANCCLGIDAKHNTDPAAPEYQKPYNPVSSRSCTGCAASWMQDTAYPITEQPYNINTRTITAKLTR